ncbi:hypothetical protein E7811_05310 [Aliigemmobacter aestuarii]|uniref:OmpA-like domain-containing protein n=1 Tax=Aliigemmobacter aestuarii TaxID=1445661 RepID=A0A4S3MUD0_9RHOB|nr:OmpA family protein [Gemmobacter aestuarii]THD85131.1 hypothetical protein E7811_05310 [Gemmobacter aestuarii]
MRFPRALVVTAAFLAAAILAILAAFLTALGIEGRSASVVNTRLLNDGITWVTVEPDGLKLYMRGTAPNEAARFRAVNLAGSVIDASRVRDELEVTPVRAIEAPRFSVEMLRNDDGLQLIGLLPAGIGGADPVAVLTQEAENLASGLTVTDMLETAAFPAPEGWEEALGYGLTALRMLPRSKISVAVDSVAITAISDSESEKRRLESELARLKPEGLPVRIDISAPRPVLTPFTLRFIIDDSGARFDACSADTERARNRIIAAAVAAGAEGKAPCTIGLGVPSPSWSEAAEAGIRAVAALGAGSFTMSDADLTLQATETTSQASFDRVVGDLRAALPDVFSLTAILPPKPSATQEGPAEFTAVLGENGRVELRGRVTDDLMQKAVDSYARAQFGADEVYTATRLDENLPEGWSIRVLAGLESLAELAEGSLLVRADLVEVKGITGSQGARARITQVLSDKLGQGQSFRVNVTYDEKRDPLAALPTPEECLAEINAAMTRRKITFAPGSTEIDADANQTMDALAEILKTCPGLQLEIGGHTDSQGSEEGNRALSQARAEAVLIALQGRRAPVELMTAVGYGETRPIADNGTEEGREANRRIEFTLLGGTAPDAVETESGGEAAGEDATATAGTPAEPPATDQTAADQIADGDGPDFSNDDSPSVAPTEPTIRPRKRP